MSDSPGDPLVETGNVLDKWWSHVRCPRVKICGITNQRDALLALRFGADALGIRIRPKLNEPEAKKIVAILPPLITPVLLTYRDGVDEIIRLCNSLEISSIQVYSNLGTEDVHRIRSEVLGARIILSFPVTGPEAIDRAVQIQNEADAILLDTRDSLTGRIGGTGLSHDWKISRDIVNALSKPVILAGGLTPDNVKEAIGIVNPWGVDCETGVEREDGYKDYQRLEEFISKAKGLTF